MNECPMHIDARKGTCTLRRSKQLLGMRTRGVKKMQRIMICMPCLLIFRHSCLSTKRKGRMILSWHQRGPQLPPQVQSISLADIFHLDRFSTKLATKLPGLILRHRDFNLIMLCCRSLELSFSVGQVECALGLAAMRRIVSSTVRGKNIAMRRCGGKAPQPPTNPNAPDSRPPPPPQHPPNNRPNPHHHQAIIRVPFENLIFRIWTPKTTPKTPHAPQAKG